jgi:hypothetical protein
MGLSLNNHIELGPQCPDDTPCNRCKEQEDCPYGRNTMKEGQRVCYDRAHWEWLDNAGLIPRNFMPRTEFQGTITAVYSDTTAIVTWDAGRHTPRRLKVTVPGLHLLSNLEPAEDQMR